MHPLDQTFLDAEPVLRGQIQQCVADSTFYCKNVKKSSWASQGYQYTYPVYEKTIEPANPEFRAMPNLDTGTNLEFGISTYQISFKKVAVNSPKICVEDFKFEWQIKDVQKHTGRVLLENAKWIWENAFQNETLNLCENKIVTQDFKAAYKTALQIAEENGVSIFDCKALTSKVVQFPPRVNFRGKRVYPYASEACTRGSRWLVNPEYKKAAEQVIVWHPDIVEFLFPDVDNWAGELAWRNIPSSEHNPDGIIGFFRMLFAYAAKPKRPDLGTVITVLPPGLKGWFWYWAWKIVGFKP